MITNETIAAISSAYGEGGIGIIRMSGEESKDILEKIFIPGKSTNKIKHPVNRHMYYGTIVNPQENDSIIDEVMVVFMEAPHTYTTEDVVEIYCHGSVVSLRKILALTLAMGAQNAEPGEFTKRAFLNGRIDLTQAEAVIDVIKSKTDKGFGVAVDQMEGKLSEKIEDIRADLRSLLAEITVNIDYPDEDNEDEQIADLKNRLELIDQKIINLIDTADTGRMIKEGIKIVIAGKPNVGKSSLLNSFLKESRAIVTEVPGTTRDTIEEYMSLQGIPIKLTDTAGVRDTDDKIEKIGIEKTKAAFDASDLILLLLDGSVELDDDDFSLLEKSKDMERLILINKSDLEQKTTRDDIKKLEKNMDSEKIMEADDIMEISVKEDAGLVELENRIVDMVFKDKIKQGESVLITNVRHKNQLEKAHRGLVQAMNMIDINEALDFIEVDVKQSFDDMGEITGNTVNDDILEEVFSKFCVGK